MEQDIPKEAKKPLGVQQPLIMSVLNHLQCEVRLSQQLSRGVSRGLPCTSGCTNYPEPFLSCSTLRGLCAWLAGGSSTSQRPNDRRREEKLQEKERETGFLPFCFNTKAHIPESNLINAAQSPQSPQLLVCFGRQLRAHSEGHKPTDGKHFWGNWGA